MKLRKMLEIYLKYDNMHTIVIINAFICINNHVNSYDKMHVINAQPFVKNTSQLVGGANVRNQNGVVVDLNVLGALIEGWVDCKENVNSIIPRHFHGTLY